MHLPVSHLLPEESTHAEQKHKKHHPAGEQILTAQTIEEVFEV